MNDPAIQNALSRIAEIQKRIVRYEDAIRKAKEQVIEIQSFLKQWEKFSGISLSEVSGANTLEYSPDFVKSPDRLMVERPRNPKKEIVATEVIHILRDHTRPLNRAELLKFLRERGVVIHGSNPEMVLSTMLWRTKDSSGIARLPSGGYVLKSLDSSSIEDTKA